MAVPDCREILRRVVAACDGTLEHCFWKDGDLHFSVAGLEEPTLLQAQKLERMYNLGSAEMVTVKVEGGLFVAIFAPK